jgi:HEAT repeat protein
MKKCLWMIPLAIKCSLLGAVELDACDSIAVCMDRLQEIASHSGQVNGGIGKDAAAVGEKLASFGDAAVDELIPLLKDRNPRVVLIASYALRDTKHIDARYLPDIVAALDTKDRSGWLAPALGRIDTDEAAREAVRHYVGSKSAPENQEAYAVKLSGRRAVPFIIDAAICKTPCGKKDHYELGSLLREMDVESKKKAADLINMNLSNPELSSEAVDGIIYMLGFLGEPAQIAEPRLLEMRTKNADISAVINNALIGMKSVHAAELFATQLKKNPDYLVLNELANMGIAGHDAGDVVLSLLDNNSPRIRIAAAEALGSINYKEAVPKLIAILSDKSDVNLNGAAAESLGRLRDSSASTALERTAKDHWYPAVRQSAGKALLNLKYGTEYSSEKKNIFSDSNIDGFGSYEIATCQKIALKEVEESKDRKLHNDYAGERLKDLSYPSEVVGYGASDEDEQKAANPGGIIEVNSGNMVEHRNPITQVPDLALRIERGWLVGSDRGEWGGELAYIEDGHAPQIILRENVEDIYKLGDRYVAVSGLAHLFANRGQIYELTPTEEGWSAAPWRALPGAPQSSWLVKTGDLLVNTSGGGSILISSDGSMRLAECAP